MSVTVCLNMIVKNEAKVIERALQSVLGLIDYWVICDTGSSDTTKDLIRAFFQRHEVPGELHEHTWVNFGVNRTLALRVARRKATYLLLMDADMELQHAAQSAASALKASLTHGLYTLKQEPWDVASGTSSGLVYYNTRLVRADLALEYIGATHEYIECTTAHVGAAQRLEALWFKDWSDGGNRADKFDRDIRLLQAALVETPRDPRTHFYLARSYEDKGEFARATEYYQKRIDLGGWEEEVWYAMYRRAFCVWSAGAAWDPTAVQLLLAAYRYCPQRAEPLYWLMHHHRLRDECAKAYAYAPLALATPQPGAHVLFLDTTMYTYKIKDEVALCAYKVGHLQHAHALWADLLARSTSASFGMPPADRARIQRDFALVEQALASATAATATVAPTDAAVVHGKKPILCVYIGYGDITCKALYGSELALVALAEQLGHVYDVYIFGGCMPAGGDVHLRPSVICRHSDRLAEFQASQTIDVLLIWRYVHYFLEYTLPTRVRQTYIWLHDTTVLPWWQFKLLPGCGKHLLENMASRLSGLVAVSPWHKTHLAQQYALPPDKIFVLGNALPSLPLANTPRADAADVVTDAKADAVASPARVRNRFIWTASADRGLDKLLEYFPDIRRLLPDATLFVFRDHVSAEQAATMRQQAGYVVYGGHCEHAQLMNEFAKSDYWLYPTAFCETYCTSALEAQAAGCVCIATRLAALETTLGDRGILLDEPLHTDAYKNEILRALARLADDEATKNEMRVRAQAWAARQTWEQRAHEWLQLFSVARTDPPLPA